MKYGIFRFTVFAMSRYTEQELPYLSDCVMQPPANVAAAWNFWGWSRP